MEVALRKRLILLNGSLSVQRKRKGVLACEDSPISTRRCFVNGVGDSPMRGTLFGERSLVASLVRA